MAATCIAIGRFFIETRTNPAPRKPAAAALSDTFATPTVVVVATGDSTGTPGVTAIGIPGGAAGGSGGPMPAGGPLPASSTFTVESGNDWKTAEPFDRG